jgi:DNA-directed RNA polymerase subunit RPC12/RpoP
MLYCPKCKSKVSLELIIDKIPGEFSPNILVNSLSLVLCSIGELANFKVENFRCQNCGTRLQWQELLIKSQISQMMTVASEYIIVSIRNKSDDYHGKKPILVVPPKIIHKSELEAFKKYNPYQDDKYLIINPLTIEIITGGER